MFVCLFFLRIYPPVTGFFSLMYFSCFRRTKLISLTACLLCISGNVNLFSKSFIAWSVNHFRLSVCLFIYWFTCVHYWPVFVFDSSYVVCFGQWNDDMIPLPITLFSLPLLNYLKLSYRNLSNFLRNANFFPPPVALPIVPATPVYLQVRI